MAHAWYGWAEWKRKRAALLKEYPVCVMCRRAESVIADHVIPHRGNFDKFWNGALQALCKRCHDSTKQRMERSKRKIVGRDGWPVG